MRSRTVPVVVATVGLIALPMVASAAAPAQQAAAQQAAAANPEANRRAKNVIMLIGDGMGANQIDLTSIYQTGKTYRQIDRDPVTGKTRKVKNQASQVFETFPVQTWMATWSLSTGAKYQSIPAWAQFGWVNTPGVTDSAAAGTALATGHKTLNGVLGMQADKTSPLRNLTEAFEAAGRSTGVVTSVPFGHATPASYVVHTAARTANHDIAQQMLDSTVDVIMGAGHPMYDDNAAPRPASWTWLSQEQYETLRTGKSNFTYVDDAASFTRLANAKSDLPNRVFGLARAAETLQSDRDGIGVDAGKGVRPYQDAFNEGVPSLETMTRGALNVLSQDDDGFFLMVEGGAIDWEGHSNNAARTIEETSDFIRSVEAAVAWVEKHSSWNDTMLVVTADHETGYLAGPGANPAWTALSGRKGTVADHSWHSKNHTNMLVPVYARGAGAKAYLDRARSKDVVRGRYLDNTDVAAVQFAQLNRR